MRKIIVVSLSMLFVGCAGVNKNMSANQPSAKVGYDAYTGGALFLAKDIECGSLFGLPNNTRDAELIIRIRDKGRQKNAAIVIPAAENQVFYAKPGTTRKGSARGLWFKFPVQANKTYQIGFKKQVTGQLFSLVDQKKHVLSVTDESGKDVVFEKVQHSNNDSACKVNFDPV